MQKYPCTQITFFVSLCLVLITGPSSIPTSNPTIQPTIHPSNDPIINATIMVLAKSKACFSATTYVNNYTFNPPYNGQIIGIRLIHQSGSVTCDYEHREGTNWGCLPDDFYVQMIEHDGGSIYYPTNTTQGVDYTASLGSCNKGCSIWYYQMRNNDVNDTSIEFIDYSNRYQVDISQTFSLQYSEGCCDFSAGDNNGTSCADVYFIYSNITTLVPTMYPTSNPSKFPTEQPSKIPTLSPTNEPTIEPTIDPTIDPSITPTFNPTSGISVTIYDSVFSI